MAKNAQLKISEEIFEIYVNKFSRFPMCEAETRRISGNELPFCPRWGSLLVRMKNPRR